jgi:hypothetical protein
MNLYLCVIGVGVAYLLWKYNNVPNVIIRHASRLQDTDYGHVGEVSR